MGDAPSKVAASNLPERIHVWLHPDVPLHVEGSHYSSKLLAVIFTLGMAWMLYSVFLARTRSLRSFVRDVGVRVKRVRKAAREIERKTFHLTGLIVPLLYSLMLDYLNFSHRDCVTFFASGTAFGWAVDIARIHLKLVSDNFPLRHILREKEQNQLCGACYFSLGVTLAIAFFPPEVAMCSIVFLVLGDLSAALIGVSFGGDTVVVKLGREGKKSAEGSLAMLVVCFAVGALSFLKVPLGEYVAFVGAITATLVELYEPFSLNDNLTIPPLSCAAMVWALNRVESSACNGY